MKYLNLILLLLVAIALGCNNTKTSSTSEDDPYARLQAIPAADAKKFGQARDYKSWRNPYLMVRKDGVGLLDFANREECVLKLEDLPYALARLPASAWPYGRVVAVTEEKVKSPDEQALIRKNRGSLAGTLEGFHILIDWVPST